jgi:2-polyprenyl-6-methoxyphenol hydroxylase-like FAD-dependent oxidoreductase
VVGVTLATVDRYRSGRVPAVGDHAVVVGGSVAGLLAGRVLADAFERVTVLEKDDYPDAVEARRGVPQGSHIHALQEPGRATFEDLFPGYGEDLIDAGALLLDATSDLRYYAEGGFLADGATRMPAYSATRPLFEAVLRRRVEALDGIDLRSGCRVAGYLADDDATAVEGVRVRDAGEERLPADLVVDATGRTSKTPGWLEENGYEPPRVEDVGIDVAYSTVAVERPPGDRRAVLQVAAYPDERGCAVFPVEGDRWLVNLHGVHGDHPPTDADGLRAFAETLPIPHAERALAAREWAWDEPDYYPFPSSRRRYYEDLERFPDGLVVVGDAIASFNPIYGQGMSVAALEALELHHALAAGGRRDLARRFFDRAAGAVDVAWSMAVGSDHRFPATTGPKPRGSGLFARYFARVVRAAHDDPRLRDAVMRVVGMERPPTSLLGPRIAARALGPALRIPGLGNGSDAPGGDAAGEPTDPPPEGDPPGSVRG